MMAIIPKVTRAPLGVVLTFTSDKTGAERFSLAMSADDASAFAGEIQSAAEPAPADPARVLAVVGGETIYQAAECKHEDVQPIAEDPDWGRCAACREDGFPLSDEAADTGIDVRCGTFAAPEPTVHVPAGDVCPLCGGPVVGVPVTAKPNAEAVLAHRDCQSPARGASWVLA